MFSCSSATLLSVLSVLFGTYEAPPGLKTFQVQVPLPRLSPQGHLSGSPFPSGFSKKPSSMTILSKILLSPSHFLPPSCFGFLWLPLLPTLWLILCPSNNLSSMRVRIVCLICYYVLNAPSSLDALQESNKCLLNCINQLLFIKCLL